MLFKSGLAYTLFCCLTIVSCGEKIERISGEGAIVEVQRYKHWLSVYTGPNANRTDFIRMDKFGDFRPGTSPLQIMLSYKGEAEKLRMWDSPSQGVEYANQSGRIRITSEDGVYPVYFFPHNRRPNFLLTQLVLKYINPNAQEEVIGLFECGFEQPYISVFIEGGQVQEVIWHDESALPRRSDSSQCTD